MAVNATELQPLAKSDLPRYLGSLRQIRKTTAKIIRRMERDEIELGKGKSLIWALTQLHGMLRAELNPAAPAGSTTNVFVAAGTVSPAVQLVEDLWRTRPERLTARSLTDGLVAIADTRSEPDGFSAPVAVQSGVGSTDEP